mmetsp:Transcript_1689/g.3482  ORF Transcript_1689/g.3482 Transcript_1689/m.3482 type:complete len:172 (+) Transcript_1689:840-1355(+)
MGSKRKGLSRLTKVSEYWNAPCQWPLTWTVCSIQATQQMAHTTPCHGIFQKIPRQDLGGLMPLEIHSLAEAPISVSCKEIRQNTTGSTSSPIRIEMTVLLCLLCQQATHNFLIFNLFCRRIQLCDWTRVPVVVKSVITSTLLSPGTETIHYNLITVAFHFYRVNRRLSGSS